MLRSDTSPDVNTSEIRCLKPGTIALLREVIMEPHVDVVSQIARHVGPTLGQRGADRIHVGPPWGQRSLLSVVVCAFVCGRGTHMLPWDSIYLFCPYTTSCYKKRTQVPN